jgi:aspartyl-tRNA(Asn)/glutamyl-tRNA(Gln) amidotransferase subunit A
VTVQTPTTIGAAGQALRERTVRARDLLESCLERIEALNPSLNAFVLVDAEGARAAADHADIELDNARWRGPLHGIPISLKDLLDQAGLPTTAGSLSLRTIPQADAPAVAHLRAAGAVLVGKCNMHEFAMGTTTDDSGFGPARHPLDPARSPGGSSGGSAIAVRTGMSLGSIGSDTGGSVRIPAAACGLVGIKPAWGEVSLEGVVPLSPTLDCVGPLAHTVEDAWWLVQGLIGQSQSMPQVAGLAGGGVAAVPRTFAGRVIDEEVREVFARALSRLERAGLVCRDVELATEASFAPTYMTIVMREALAYHAPRMQAHAAEYTPRVRARLDGVAPPSASEYADALARMDRIRAEVDDHLAAADVLVLPALAIEPPALHVETVRVGATDVPVRAAMLRLTQPFNMSRHPALSLPCGATAAGFPVGLQVVARTTADVVRWARTFQRVLGTPAVV